MVMKFLNMPKAVHFHDTDARIVNDVEDFLKDCKKNRLKVPDIFVIHGCKYGN